MQPKLDLMVLFVSDPLKSSAFYSRLFGNKPVEEAPTFALFALTNGVQLGLWSKRSAEPAVQVTGGGCEICFHTDQVDQCYEQWQAMQIPMAQTPIDMDFGRTFVALDPDGHRIRVYRLWENQA
jgi:predicted enzyme related to lactoylglutathione lyase